MRYSNRIHILISILLCAIKKLKTFYKKEGKTIIERSKLLCREICCNLVLQFNHIYKVSQFQCVHTVILYFNNIKGILLIISICLQTLREVWWNFNVIFKRANIPFYITLKWCPIIWISLPSYYCACLYFLCFCHTLKL